MITIKRFSFEPDTIKSTVIEPIEFNKGLNIILGERSENSEKMNSVGKSLLVEMINYCLLSESSMRINKIPLDILNEDTYMCLELEIETDKDINSLLIKRTRNKDKLIIMEYKGTEQEFEKTDHAKSFLESLIFNNISDVDRPSLRNLISILIREEKSSFDDILRPYATKSFLDFNELIRPHLYLFGFDISVVEKMKHVQKNISDSETTVSNIKKTFKSMGIDIKTVKSYINDLKEIVNKLSLSVTSLEPGEGLKQRREKLQELEIQIELAVAQRSSKEGLIKKIKRLPKFDEVDSDKIGIIYNTFKSGLGDIVKKSIDDVQHFHEKIETFQNQLFNQRLKGLQTEVSQLNQKIAQLDKEISDIYRTFKAEEKIDGLKKALKEEREKNDELNELSQRYAFLEQKIAEIKLLEKEREKIIEEIDTQISNKKEQINNFEDDLKGLHTVITGNAKCQFDIRTSDQKDYIKIDYRIDLDGGSGMDRIRTFMYDILLLISKVTSPRHLGFLIHDNIFPSTGRDDMVKSLNYINDEYLKKQNFQYIVTLNKDEFEAQVDKFSFKTIDVTKAVFTREKPFLGTAYREI